MVCGAPANRTQRLVAAEERVLVGAGEAYEARCRRCWTAEPVAGTPGRAAAGGIGVAPR